MSEVDTIVLPSDCYLSLSIFDFAVSYCDYIRLNLPVSPPSSLPISDYLFIPSGEISEFTALLLLSSRVDVRFMSGYCNVIPSIFSKSLFYRVASPRVIGDNCNGFYSSFD